LKFKIHQPGLALLISYRSLYVGLLIFILIFGIKEKGVAIFEIWWWFILIIVAWILILYMHLKQLKDDCLIVEQDGIYRQSWFNKYPAIRRTKKKFIDFKDLDIFIGDREAAFNNINENRKPDSYSLVVFDVDNAKTDLFYKYSLFGFITKRNVFRIEDFSKFLTAVFANIQEARIDEKSMLALKNMQIDTGSKFKIV
jgi:hypothetical protein